MKISVVSRSGREIIKGGLELSDDATVEDLQKAVHQYNKKWYPERQRFTLSQEGQAKPQVLQQEKKLSCYFDTPTGKVVFKDLGPQVSYKGVFFWEYFGPLVVYALFYFFPGVFYASLGGRKVTHPVQSYALAYWSFHYIKRIFETFFIHRFSHGTMPLLNLFKNCGYYWSFAALVSYFVNHPLYTPVGPTQQALGFTFALLNQAANLYCHIILRNLRPPGAKGYEIPKGFLFNFITCANYTTEIYAWLGFNIATQTLTGILFMIVGAAQMAAWAIAKHKRLRKIFDGKDGRPRYPRRWIMLPPIL